jgi:hypothetical protein
MPESILQTSVVHLRLTATPLGGAPLARGVLPFTLQHQNETQWCWAAVTSSVAGYYQNPSWTQCNLANNQFGQTTCCSNGSSTVCNEPWYLDRALGTVRNLANFIAGALSLTQIQSEIDAGRPIGVRIGWPGGGGHFVTITGYSDQNVINVQDPWYAPQGAAVDYMTFRFVYQGSGQWTHTYLTTRLGGQYAAATR